MAGFELCWTTVDKIGSEMTNAERSSLGECAGDDALGPREQGWV